MGEHDHGYIGTVDYTTLEENNEYIVKLLDNNAELQKLKKSSLNAYKQYLKSCGKSSKESRSRYKEDKHREIGVHPCLLSGGEGSERRNMLQDIKNYKAKQTIFEFCPKITETGLKTMKKKRKAHEKTIYRYYNKKAAAEENNTKEIQEHEDPPELEMLAQSTEDDLLPLMQSTENNKKKQQSFRDEEHYIPHYSADHHSERGLVGSGSFAADVNDAVVNFTADDDVDMRKQKSRKRWDQKKKKFVGENIDPKKRKVQTESGAWISASYKTDKYKKWAARNKVEHQHHDDDDDDDDGAGRGQNNSHKYYGRNAWKNGPRAGKKGITILNGMKRPGLKVNPETSFSKRNSNPRKELKSNEQVLSNREKKIEKQVRHLRILESAARRKKMIKNRHKNQ